MTNLLSPGVKLLPNLVARIEENLMRKFGNLNLSSSPVNTATCCIIAGDCMWASFQKSRAVDTCIRCCQKHSFPNTQDTLNILIGSILENEQGGEPVILRDEEKFVSECLIDVAWEKPSVARGAKWEHAHSKSACVLRLNLLHRPRFAGFHQCVETPGKEGSLAKTESTCRSDDTT